MVYRVEDKMRKLGATSTTDDFTEIRHDSPGISQYGGLYITLARLDSS